MTYWPLAFKKRCVQNELSIKTQEVNLVCACVSLI